VKAASARDKAALKEIQQDVSAKAAELHKKMAARPLVSMPNGRLTVETPDGAFSLALRSTVQFDGGYFSQGRNPAGVDLNSGTNFRRAQLGVVGTLWRDWSYNFTYDFGGSGTENRGYVYRAYIQYDGLAPLAFRVGAFSAFDSIEDAHQYVSLLGEVLDQTQDTIQEDIAMAQSGEAARRLEALLLVRYKLERLRHHMGASRHILNDLRTLRRLLLGEREGVLKAVPGNRS